MSAPGSPAAAGPGAARHHLILILGTLAVVLIASFHPIVDFDIWWHLKTGELILSERAVPRAEVYSHTAEGTPWVDHEWLFQVIAYLAHAGAGETGVIILRSALLLAIFALTTRRLIRAGASVPVLIGIQCLSIGGSFTRFVERPELFTILFAAILWVIVDDYLDGGACLVPRQGRKGLRAQAREKAAVARRQGARSAAYALVREHRSDAGDEADAALSRDLGAWRRLLLLIPLMILWANIHVGVVLGLMLLAGFVVGSTCHSLLARHGYPSQQSASPRFLAMMLAALTAATVVNPYGIHLLRVPFELTSIIDSGILDNLEWRQPSPLVYPLYYVSVLLVLAVHAMNFRRLNIPSFLNTCLLAYISLKYLRNVGTFCMLMPLMVAPYLPRLQPRRARQLIFAAVAAAGLLLSLTRLNPYPFGLGRADYFPEGAARFVRAQRPAGNMWNPYGIGGYLIWRLWPDARVFQDGRNEVFVRVLAAEAAGARDPDAWERLLREHNVEYAVLSYDDRLHQVAYKDSDGSIKRTSVPASEGFFPRRDWALVFWDDSGMVFIRRGGLNERLAQLEYASVYPEGRGFMGALVRMGQVSPDAARRELQRKLAEEPGCLRARALLDSLD